MAKRFLRLARSGVVATALSCSVMITECIAQDVGRRHDKDLLRLSELLGTIHYLRELCGENDGQRWRTQMQALIDAEGTTPLRRVVLTKRFNKGYRTFQRTYRDCTATARTAIARFVSEGAEIANRLADKGG